MHTSPADSLYQTLQPAKRAPSQCSSARRGGCTTHHGSALGQTSSTILMLDKQLTHLTQERDSLLAQNDALMRDQHRLENELEEARVALGRSEEGGKAAKKRA